MASEGSVQTLILLAILVVLTLIWKTRAAAATAPMETVNPNKAAKVKLAIAALMRKPIDLMLWLEHHRKAGIYRFYIRLEDSPGVAAFLNTQPDVVFVEAESDPENNYTTLQKRQITFVNEMLVKARGDGVDWVFHTDVDELLEGDLIGILSALPADIKVGKLQNAEAVFDEDEPTCFSAKKFIRCGEAGAPCKAYVNGKGVGRTEEGVTLLGPHDFAYKGKIHGPATQKIPFDDIHVLHYDSCTIGSWLEKFQHLSKSAKLDDIVFPYYKKSIEAAKTATEVYKQNKIDVKMAPEWTYNRDPGPVV